MNPNTEAPNRVYLITHPRVASHLLIKILNLEEQRVPPIHGGGYFFKNPFVFGAENKLLSKNISTWTEEERTAMRERYEKSFSELQNWVQNAEANDQVAFVKEHTIFMADPVCLTKYLYGDTELPEHWQVGSANRETGSHKSTLNKTVLPDEFLLSFMPTFLVRHPALAFPSFIRPYTSIIGMFTEGEEALDLVVEVEPFMTFQWIRTMFQFFTENASSNSSNGSTKAAHDHHPLVLDADDVLDSPEIVLDYAKLIGLDPEKLTLSWSPATEQLIARISQDRWSGFVSTIVRSSGILKGKSAQILDLEVETKKWTVEFGETFGEKLVGWVKAAMNDYEFFRERRLRPGQNSGK